MSQSKFNYELFNSFRVVCRFLNDVYHLAAISNSLKLMKTTLLNMYDLAMSYLN